MSFENQVQQYVSVDNQIKILNEKIKTLRDTRNVLTERLTSHATSNNMMNSTINISDGKLRFTDVKVQSPLTFKYVERVLGEVIVNKLQVSQIMEHLKQKREVKIIKDIKRFSNI
jgi:hypothetical protein